MFSFLKGFVYAANGLVVFFRHERNGRIQLFIALFVISGSFIIGISRTEWVVVLACIASVLSFEMINSSIEKICNLVHPKVHPAVKTIKDIAAGAVLFVAFISTIIGAVIFLPKLL